MSTAAPRPLYVLPTSPHPEIALLASVPAIDLVARYRVGVENYDPRVLSLTDGELDRWFEENDGVGKWSCRVLIGHVADAELSYTHRIRRALAEDGPVYEVWDEDAFVASGLYGGPRNGVRFPIGGFIAATHTIRQWMSEFLGTLTPAQWERHGLHPQRGKLTVRAMVETLTWHIEHHAWYLNRKVERLSGG